MKGQPNLAKPLSKALSSSTESEQCWAFENLVSMFLVIFLLLKRTFFVFISAEIAQSKEIFFLEKFHKIFSHC